jgi:bifunctional non-homologous end joining protein LigD
MLSRPGPLPQFGNWSYEVKWDGFRAIVGTVGALRVRSRRGWNMTALVPELEALPAGLVLDGELVAFDDDGLPWFPSVCDRLLHGDDSIPLTLVVFDLLHERTESLLHLPYRERRARLEALELRGPSWHTSERFDDGERLYATVSEHGLEGIVAKPSGSAYRPGHRGWLKIKNPDYWRRPDELRLACR